MPVSNRAFLDTVKGSRARFYLADFHVHSPGSIDFCGSDGQPVQLCNDAHAHDTQAITTFPVSEHYLALVDQRNTVFRETCSPDQDYSAVIAITDHNVCGYACALAEHARDPKLLQTNRLLILPGMELTTTFPVADEGLATAHILLAFAPGVEKHQVFAAIREASAANWDFGTPVEVPDLPNFVRCLRHHPTYPAIVIAAHVNSSRGVQKETRKLILSRLDAAILHLQAALAFPDNTDKAIIEHDLALLMQKRADEDGISFRVLQLLGICGFDALQIAAKEDHHHYRRLHRCQRDLGRAVPIISSDAHRVTEIFHTQPAERTHHPFVKLITNPCAAPPADLLEQLRSRSLRYGETRFSYVPPGRITAWIEAVEILPDANDAASFWPYKSASESTSDTSTGSFTLHFSQNLNCLIGGRGSGKSAALEAIGFATCPSAFEDKEYKKQEWYKRAANTLKGCRLRVCWRLLNAPELDLKKNALFVTRYFDPSHNHTRPVLTNLDDKELSPKAWQHLDVEFFRLHDIEAAAQPERLRALFDRFCGERTAVLKQEISTLKDQLYRQRIAMLKVATGLAELTASHSPLREYARRKLAYNEANRDEIREQFEELDNAEVADRVARDARQSWDDVINNFDLDARRNEVQQFFKDLAESISKPDESGTTEDSHKEVTDSAKAAEPNVRRFMDPLAVLAPDADNSSSRTITENINRLSSSLNAVQLSLAESSAALDEKHKECREAVAAQGYPKGGADRQMKKKALDEADHKLDEYRVLMKDWERLLSERLNVFAALEAKCKERTQLRRKTAEEITNRLARDLDQRILRIEADAQPVNDKTEFIGWLEKEVDWTAYRNRAERIRALLYENQILPAELRTILLNSAKPDPQRLVVEKERVQDGRITSQEASDILAVLKPCERLPSEVAGNPYAGEFIESLPVEIRDGLTVFRAGRDGKSLLIDAALRLDEIVLDDEPIIRFNDRPLETSVMKPLERLSQGQKCSAILPILLLTGVSPLVIDQPEDNLDNRLIRQVIVNVLASIKLRRQVIVATHNPNLPVLGDAEQVIALRAVEDDRCAVQAIGSLDDREVVHQITEIMEGGREAFQYRQSIYEVQWVGGASTS